MNHGERRFAPDESTVLEGTINADVEPERVTVLERNEQTSEGLSGLHASKTTDTSSGLRTSKTPMPLGLSRAKTLTPVGLARAKTPMPLGLATAKGLVLLVFTRAKPRFLSLIHI